MEKRNNINLPLFLDIIQLKVFYERLDLSNSIDIENIVHKLSYRLAYDNEKKRNLKDDCHLLDELYDYVCKSSIIVNYSHPKKPVTSKEVIFIKIKTINFDWLDLLDNEENFYKLSSNDFINFESELGKHFSNIFTSKIRNYLLVKFFAISMMQLIDFYIRALNSMTNFPLNSTKNVIVKIDDEFSNFHTHIKNIFENLLFSKLFRFNNESCNFYINQIILDEGLIDDDLAHLKVIYNASKSSNNNYISSLGFENYQSENLQYKDEVFFNICLSTIEFNKLNFQGVIFRTWYNY